MNRRESVDKIMTKNIFIIDVGNTIQDASEVFEAQSVNYLPVLSKNKLVGILSRADVMQLSFIDAYAVNEVPDSTLSELLSLEDIMEHNPPTLKSSDPITKAAETLIEKNLNVLPVVDYGELTGLITTSDVIKYQLNKLTNAIIPEKYSEHTPWGNFEQFCQNIPCTVKIVNVNPYEELSLQYHHHRRELWRVINGKGTIIIGDEQKAAKAGDEFVVPKRVTHRIITEESPLQIMELSFGLFDENDTVKLEDNYKRTKPIQQPVLI